MRKKSATVTKMNHNLKEVTRMKRLVSSVVAATYI